MLAVCETGSCHSMGPALCFCTLDPDECIDGALRSRATNRLSINSHKAMRSGNIAALRTLRFVRCGGNMNTTRPGDQG